jgi:hypothetical protein
VSLTANEIAGYALTAQFDSNSAKTITAVALAESGGDPNDLGDVALEDSTWGPSVGLCQIRSLKPDAQGSISDPWRDATKLTDPLFNMQAAYSISNGGTNFNPWTDYTNGLYQLHMPAAASGVASPVMPSSSGTSDNTTAVKDASYHLPTFTGLASALGDFISPDWWKRIGLYVLGFFILLAAITLLFRKDLGKSAVLGAEGAALA